MAMHGQLDSQFRACASGPSGRLRRPPPHKWGGPLPQTWGVSLPHTWGPLPKGGPLPHMVKTGRRLGELVLRRGVRLGKGSACLSLGRGTQPAGSWATICCVPGAVITPNVVAVKTFADLGT